MTTKHSLKSFTLQVIDDLKNADKTRTSETYKSALGSFLQFNRNTDLSFEAIDSELMQRYQLWLQKRGVVDNTISFYMRILRAIYNRAVERGITTDKRPFAKVYTGVAKTIKRAISLNDIRHIKHLDLKGNISLEYARDIFMLSFYLRGMSFIDMAYLKKSDLRRGYLTYRRRKTGQKLTIQWTREMQEIIDRYQKKNNPFLLPILTEEGSRSRSQYRNKSYNINYNLKRISNIAGIEREITLYVARHSWASIAHNQGVPISVISQGMGHDSEATTRIYLSTIDAEEVDRANRHLIHQLTK